MYYLAFKIFKVDNYIFGIREGNRQINVNLVQEKERRNKVLKYVNDLVKEIKDDFNAELMLKINNYYYFKLNNKVEYSKINNFKKKYYNIFFNNFDKMIILNIIYFENKDNLNYNDTIIELNHLLNENDIQPYKEILIKDGKWNTDMFIK